uniref:Reverse transcriptase zinc-binding domain-containing protein n=1 Tax=Musa acuminata subsp. malaccensis TaxID=214687 RepID=A0A804J7W7_MUSAM
MWHIGPGRLECTGSFTSTIDLLFLWSVDIPRYSFISWLVCLNKLSTLDRLIMWRIQNESTTVADIASSRAIAANWNLYPNFATAKSTWHH